MNSKKVIEVNGRRYDATTGALLGGASAPPLRTSGRNMDGFFRSRTSAPKTLSVSEKLSTEKIRAEKQRAEKPRVEKITVLAAPAPTPAPVPRHRPSRTINHAQAHAPQPVRVVRVRTRVEPSVSQSVTVRHHAAVVNHTKAHTLQTSVTLMRKSVQRPTPSFHKQAGTVGALQHAVPSLIIPKASVASLDPSRLVRAQSTARSPHISRHATAQHHRITPMLAPVAVQPVPTTAPGGDTKPGNEDPSAPAPLQPNNPTDMFEKALMNANHFVDLHAHRKQYRRRAQRHIASMAAGAFALIVIAGFAAYQNTPGLQFRVASIQAGVSTHMPNLQAAGFAYKGAHAADGKLAIAFSDKHANYQLTQSTTNLSGDDMIQIVGATDASGYPNYQTLHTGTTTVYRFSTTNATWVSNGTWYTVNGNSPLSDSQVESLVHNV
jgi:hypothetical protein